jgi:hypothetical protein
MTNPTGLEVWKDAYIYTEILNLTESTMCAKLCRYIETDYTILRNVWVLHYRQVYCGMSAESRNSLIRRDVRCYAMARESQVTAATLTYATTEQPLGAVFSTRFAATAT